MVGCLVLLTLDLLADPISGHRFAFGTGQFVLFVTVMLVVATLYAARYVAAGYALLCVLAATVVILLTAIDLASAFITERLQREMRASWAGLGAEQDQIAVDQNDFDDRLAYQPFVTWRHTPYASATTNVDSGWYRVTVGSRCAEGTFRVLMFGGSTMWGYQASDGGTIPSHLQASLSRATARPVCVVNAGELAWVSSQEVVMLTRLLGTGDVPDAVIFYDGVNDVYAALEPDGVPGDHLALRRVKSRMTPGLVGIVRRVATESHILAMMNAWGAHQASNHAPSPSERRQVDSLAGVVVQRYASNLQTVADLARARGIPYLFFWQPTLAAGQKPMSAAEATMCRVAPWAQRRIYHSAYRLAGQLADSMPALHDISGIFAADTTRLYVDAEHITSQGNQRVADAMMSWIVRDSQWIARLPGIDRSANELPAYRAPAAESSNRVASCASP